jgi:hypothetical protein
MSARTEPAKVVPWPAIAGWCALGALPTMVTLARGEADASFAAIAAALVLGAAAASSIDDRAAPLVASVPVSLGHRRAARLGWVVGAITLVAGALAVTIAVTDTIVQPGMSHLAALGCTTAALSMSIAARTPDELGYGAPGIAGSAGALLSVLVVSGFAQRVNWLPSPADPAHAGRWWLMAAAAALAALPAFRDPAARPVRPRLAPRLRLNLSGHDCRGP